MNKISLVKKLEKELEALEEKLLLFLNEQEVIHKEHDFEVLGMSMHAVGRPSYYWGKPSLEGEKNQIALEKDYKQFIVYIDRLMHNVPDKIKNRYSMVKQEFEKWLYLERNYNIGMSKNDNDSEFRKTCKKLKDILTLFEDNEKIILIPDTNALLTEPDPNEYKKLIDKDTFTFVLLPTVISELDKIKDKRTESSRKEKAKKIIQRIKGWKAQGKITKGITLHQTITLKAEVGEPLDNNLPNWLDLANNDDKILSYILNIQIKFPSAIIILVTRDINMQNKAETLKIEYVDIDLKEQKLP